MKIERPRGTRDLLPEEMKKRREMEKILRRIAESYGYGEIATPTFEHVELFTLKSGEGIVEEMYVFKDKSGRELALRPELTAPVMRLYVNSCEVMPKPLRFYYFANCFRYERPQKGRYREFWQFGVELIGSDSYLADAEVIMLAYEMLKALKVEFKLEIGHVGIMRDVLKGIENADKMMRLIDKNQFDELEKLMKDCKIDEKIKERVFRLIDLKGDASILEKVNFAEKEIERLKRIAEILDAAKVEYEFDLGIVRGLDYYTGVVFECYAPNLGAQKQICGGGSYELASLFGGQKTPATGFAIGFDRVYEVCEIDLDRRKTVFVVSFEDTYLDALKIAKKLRKSGFVAVIDVMERNLKKQLSYANDIKAEFAVLVGKKELEDGKVSVKDLKSGQQMDVPIEELTNLLSSRTV